MKRRCYIVPWRMPFQCRFPKSGSVAESLEFLTIKLSLACQLERQFWSKICFMWRYRPIVTRRPSPCYSCYSNLKVRLFDNPGVTAEITSQSPIKIDRPTLAACFRSCSARCPGPTQKPKSLSSLNTMLLQEAILGHFWVFFFLQFQKRISPPEAGTPRWA